MSCFVYKASSQRLLPSQASCLPQDCAQPRAVPASPAALSLPAPLRRMPISLAARSAASQAASHGRQGFRRPPTPFRRLAAAPAKRLSLSAMAAAEQPAESIPAPKRELFQEISGTGTAPWEIGRPQKEIARLTAAGTFDGCTVLDVGCCGGDNTLHVAQNAKGATVTGCDLVERALEVARKKAAAAGADVTFVQQDLLTPPQGALQGKQFDVVLDSAVYHCFQPGSDRDAYVATVEKLVKPGGTLVMFVFSDKQEGTQGPVRVSKEDIRCSYPAPKWTVESIEDSLYESVPTMFNGAAKAYTAIIRRSADA